MKIPLLFHRKSLDVPTLMGWFVISSILILLVLTLFRNMAVFLIVDETVGADFMVIEAWMSKEELHQGLEFFNTNEFQKIIFVGGPIVGDFHGVDENYAERAAVYLQAQGLPVEKTAIVPAPYSAQNRTFLNAVMVREWFGQHKIDIRRLDVFSSSIHTRRSRDLYQRAFGEQVKVGIAPTKPENFNPYYWWESSATGKFVAVEFANWFLTKCCFKPGPLDSNIEKIDMKKLE